MIFRWLILLCLVASIIAFVAYAVTGQQRFRRYGLITLKWTLFSAFVFFAVLIVERIL